MKSIVKVAVATMGIVAASGTASAQKLMSLDEGTLHGAFITHSPKYDSPEVILGKIKKYEKEYKKELKFFNLEAKWSFNFGEAPGELPFPEAHVKKFYDNGITILARVFPSADDDWSPEVPNPYDLDAINSGRLDEMLARYFQRLGNLRGSDGKLIPFLYAFGPEMNGNWFDWSGVFSGAGITDAYGDPTYPDGPEKYRDAYRRIIDIARDQGVTNITWAMAYEGHPPSELQQDVWNDYSYYYPGDEYIDWIGFSFYGPQSQEIAQWWWEFEEMLTDKYGPRETNWDDILAISKCRPLAIWELGVTRYDLYPTKKANWIRKAYETIKRYPDFRLAAYWHNKAWPGMQNPAEPETPLEKKYFREAIADLSNDFRYSDEDPKCEREDDDRKPDPK